MKDSGKRKLTFFAVLSNIGGKRMRITQMKTKKGKLFPVLVNHIA